MSQPFSHRVLPYDGADDYLAGALPYLRAGVDAGDRVLAVTSMGSELLLRDALGVEAGEVEFVEAAGWYAHPARTLADCLSDADAAVREGRRLRVLGEPAWTGRDPMEVQEWQRVEAIVNVAFAGTGASILCPYAVKSLPAGIVAAARKTHPMTVRGGQEMANPGYVDPWAYSAQCDSAPLPPPPADAETLAIELPNLFWLRAYVSDFARHTPLPDGDLQRLLVAVTEVMTNAVRHGAPPITLRLWTEAGGRDAGALVCEVTDGGPWQGDVSAGLIPPDTGGGCFGLWAVRLLCSLVQIRTGAGGTTVRLRLRLPAAVPVNTA